MNFLSYISRQYNFKSRNQILVFTGVMHWQNMNCHKIPTKQHYFHYKSICSFNANLGDCYVYPFSVADNYSSFHCQLYQTGKISTDGLMR